MADGCREILSSNTGSTSEDSKIVFHVEVGGNGVVLFSNFVLHPLKYGRFSRTFSADQKRRIWSQQRRQNSVVWERVNI